MQSYTYPLTTALFLALLPLLADSAGPAAGDPVAEIDTVTIFGKRNDAADVPGSARVIARDELQQFLEFDIMRVLRTVPGVYVQDEEGFGLRPNIGIRGSGLDRSARIALLEDGVLIAPAPYSAASAYYFPTQRRMSAIEVLKGPAAVAVGPRTTGGAINLVSTPIPGALGANLDVRGGSNRSFDTHINVGNRGERISWLLETVQAGNDGFKSIDGPVGGDTGYKIEDYVAKLQFDSTAAGALKQSLRIKLGYTNQVSDETYLGLTDADFQTDPNRRYAASANDRFVSDHRQYQATYVVDAGTRWSGEVTAYRNNFARNWYKLQSVNGTSLNSILTEPGSFALEYGYLKGATSADNALQIRANNREYFSKGIQAKIDWDLSFADTELTVVTGVRLHEDEEDRFQHQDGYRMQDGVLVLSNAGAAGSQTNRVSDASVTSVFVDSEIRRRGWIFTPGIRFENIDMRRLDYATDNPDRTMGPLRIRENTVQVLIPGMGALYRINEAWRVLAGLHKGFNPPGPGSTAGEEESVNFEAGVRYDNATLSFESIYFRNDYANLVGTVTESTGGGSDIGDQFDGGEVVVSGLELSAGYSFDVGSINIPLAFGYTWTNQAQFKNSFESDFEPWGEVAAGDRLPYIPEKQYRVAIGAIHPRFRVNLAMSYVGEMRTRAGQGATLPETTIAAHTIWDMLAAYNIDERLSTYFKIDNLLDETFIAARRPAGSRPGLPRTLYLGLTYRL